jgi:hypothetical protein
MLWNDLHNLGCTWEVDVVVEKAEEHQGHMVQEVPVAHPAVRDSGGSITDR